MDLPSIGQSQHPKKAILLLPLKANHSFQAHCSSLRQALLQGVLVQADPFA